VPLHKGVGRQQCVAEPESRLGSSGELLVGGHVPAERICQAHDHVEEGRDMNRVDERLFAPAGGEDGLGIVRGQGVRSQRELLEEAERRAKRFVNGRGAPVASNGFPDLPAEGVRRDRAVGTRSERALIEGGDECREELALPDAPVGRAVHREIERVRERPSEELRPVVESLEDIRRLDTSLTSDELEDLSLLGIVTHLETSQPHGSTSRPARNRFRPAATATETVASKMMSSAYPASFSA